MSVLNDAKQFYSYIYNNQGVLDVVKVIGLISSRDEVDRRIDIINQIYNLLLRKNIKTVDKLDRLTNIWIDATREFVTTNLSMGELCEKYKRDTLEKEVYKFNEDIEQLMIFNDRHNFKESAVTYLIFCDSGEISEEEYSNIQLIIDKIKYKATNPISDDKNSTTDPEKLERIIDEKNIDLRIPKYFYNIHGINCRKSDFEKFITIILKPYIKKIKNETQEILNNQDDSGSDIANIIGYFNYLTDSSINKDDYNEQDRELRELIIKTFSSEPNIKDLDHKNNKSNIRFDDMKPEEKEKLTKYKKRRIQF